MLMLLSRDVHPGPVTPGALQNVDADLCLSVSATPLVQQLSEPLNRLNSVNTRHDVHYRAVETLTGPVSLSQNLLLTPLCV